MRDPFPPARISAILALCATQNFYSLRECATRVMPALCHLTMDPEKSVRDQAFKALKGFISKLEKVSEDPSLAEQMGKFLVKGCCSNMLIEFPILEADLNAAGSSASNSLSTSWASWAVGSLTAKFYRSKSTTTPPVATTAQASALPSSNLSQSPNSSAPTANKSLPLSQNVSDSRSDTFAKTPSQESVTEMEENAWGSMDDEAASQKSEKSANITKTRDSLDGWEDDNWEGFDDHAPSDSSRLSTNKTSHQIGKMGDLGYEPNSKSRHSSGGSSSTAASTKGKKGNDDFFSEWEPQVGSRSTTRSMHPAPLSDSLSQTTSYETKPSATLRTNVSNSNRESEERRAQRAKENEERRAKQGGTRGPMKLGARKLNVN